MTSALSRALALAPARSLFPGVLACAVVAAAATFLSRALRRAGDAVRAAAGHGDELPVGDGPVRAGHRVHRARSVLRLGVALLGLRITLGQIAGARLGAGGAGGACAVVLTIGVSMLAARLLGFQSLFGLLTGGATAICGASAALALVGGAAGPPAEGARDAVHRDRRLRAVDAGDDRLPDDRAARSAWTPQPAGIFLGAHDPRRGAGGRRRLQHVAARPATSPPWSS